jgi:hypothetical protein
MDAFSYRKQRKDLKFMSKTTTTTTTTQYAAFAKRKDGGEWRKLNGLFYCKGKLDAQLLIDNHKDSFEGQRWPCEYKIMTREVTTIAEEWSEVL